MDQTTTTLDWYERSYATEGINAQRRYPNEELVRFMARHFFKIPREERLASRSSTPAAVRAAICG